MLVGAILSATAWVGWLAFETHTNKNKSRTGLRCAENDDQLE